MPFDRLRRGVRPAHRRRPTNSTPTAGRDAVDDARSVQRQAIAGMLWCKQYYHYDVRQWLEGDPAAAAAAAERAARPQPRVGAPGQRRRHLHARQMGISVVRRLGPGLPLRRAGPGGPGFAKDQLMLLTREWYMHPNGQLPAYEWAFGDVNPPVHAWAALAGLPDRPRAATAARATVGSWSACSTSCCSTSPGG